MGAVMGIDNWNVKIENIEIEHKLTLTKFFALQIIVFYAKNIVI